VSHRAGDNWTQEVQDDNKMKRAVEYLHPVLEVIGPWGQVGGGGGRQTGLQRPEQTLLVLDVQLSHSTC